MCSKTVLCLILAIIMCLLLEANAKKKKKFKFPNNKQYDNAIAFSYGAIGDDRQVRFSNSGKAFEWPQKVLNCNPMEVECTGHFLKQLEKVQRASTLILLVNSHTSILNADRIDVIKKVKESSLKMVKFQHESVGLHLISDIDLLKKLLTEHPAKSLYDLMQDKAIMDKFEIASDNGNDFFAFGDKMLWFVQNKYINREDVQLRLTSTEDEHPLVLLENIGQESALTHLSNILALNKSVATPEIKVWPTVAVAVTIDTKAMFLEEFFDKLANLDYPKDRLFVHVECRSKDKAHFANSVVSQWQQEGYATVSVGQDALSFANEVQSEFVFFVRSTAHLEVPNVLKVLVSQNLNIVAPFLMTNDMVAYQHDIFDYGWNRFENQTVAFHHIAPLTQYIEDIKESFERIQQGQNFLLTTKNSTKGYWRSINDWDKRIIDGTLMEQNTPLPVESIIHEWVYEREACCVWSVARIRDCYLAKRASLDQVSFPQDLESEEDRDDWFSLAMTKKGFTLNLINDQNYGQLVNLERFPVRTHPELFRFFENHDLWERRYILPKVIATQVKSKVAKPDMHDKVPGETVQPGQCPDTALWPLFTETFCDDLLEEALMYSEGWSTAKYEVVNGTLDESPTEINMYELDLEAIWLGIINFYVLPRRILYYNGLNQPDRGGHFVIVKEPEQQAVLKPNDPSTYSSYRMLLPLSDHVGGQTQFVRYKCTESDPPKGTVLAFPGDLTHLNVDLPVEEGPRYFLLSHVSTFNIKSGQRHGQNFVEDMIPIPAVDAGTEEKEKYLKAIGKIK